MTDRLLEGKTALVTGGSSGMGAEIVREMVAAGARVAAVGRDQARLSAVVEAVEGAGGTAFPTVCDLTEEGAPAAAVDEAIGALGSLDILANVAGIMELGPLESTPLESLDRQYATNVRAPFALTQAALPHLRESRGV